MILCTGCPTIYQTRHFFNNSKTNEDIATKQTHTTDTFLFISHTTNVLLFKSRCNIFICFRIIKEMPGLVGSGTPCSKNHGQKTIFKKMFYLAEIESGTIVKVISLVILGKTSFSFLFFLSY